MKKNPVITNIVDAFAILDLINQKTEIGITAISKQLDLPKTTVFRIMKSLEAVQVVKQNENSHYTLDYHILKYSKGMNINEHITTIAEPFIKEVVEKTGETVNLGMQYKEDLVILSRVHGDFYQLSASLRPVGDLYCSGMGKLFLAQWNDDDLKKYYSDLPKRTIHTISTFEEFKSIQKNIIKNNVASDIEEYEYGLSCYAVPIFDQNENIIYAISISGPNSRLEYKGINVLLDALHECAAKIQDSLFTFESE
ncbi:IclR family transcriptional regulator [Erysipelothrix urinaevulpis]|uniref:IclR family transcriptional regulator n=1 Tax=Erysipelothrix urinaevulpis TaxID=2683717 RepID=UPI00135C4052|nr:IclR family transcriptional regulator [Erysipelothrix urinaevulpis]